MFWACLGVFGERKKQMRTRVKTKQKAKNDLDEMDAAASKLALAYKKSRLRRVLTQVRHQVHESVDLRERRSGIEVRHVHASDERACAAQRVNEVRSRRTSVFTKGIDRIQAAMKDNRASRQARLLSIKQTDKEIEELSTVWQQVK